MYSLFYAAELSDLFNLQAEAYYSFKSIAKLNLFIIVLNYVKILYLLYHQFAQCLIQLNTFKKASALYCCK